VRAGRTRVAVTALPAAERVEEIARMLGGATVTAAAREHARDLLAAPPRAHGANARARGSRPV
jgi:DNA repair ATPase RecN